MDRLILHQHTGINDLNWIVVEHMARGLAPSLSARVCAHPSYVSLPFVELEDDET